MRTFKLTLAYDGTDFSGWQWQPKKRTVQDELQSALERITGERSKCAASGRTDAGVHALGQVVSFTSSTYLTPKDLTKALRAELPEDMFVFEVLEAPPNFHAQLHALRKRYRYVIEDGRVRDLFDRKYVWQIRQRLDVELMQQAAPALLGTHDFASFQSTGSRRLESTRTIYDLLVERRQDRLTERVIIEVEANGFLYNMVRNIAGTLVAVGKGKQPIAWVAEALVARDRRQAGMTAPAQGLFLIGVEYGEISDLGVGILDAECKDEDMPDE